MNFIFLRELHGERKSTVFLSSHMVRSECNIFEIWLLCEQLEGGNSKHFDPASSQAATVFRVDSILLPRKTSWWWCLIVPLRLDFLNFLFDSFPWVQDYFSTLVIDFHHCQERHHVCYVHSGEKNRSVALQEVRTRDNWRYIHPSKHCFYSSQSKCTVVNAHCVLHDNST